MQRNNYFYRQNPLFANPIGLVTRIGTKQAIYEALLNVSTLNRFSHNLFIQVPKKVSLNQNNLYIKQS